MAEEQNINTEKGKIVTIKHSGLGITSFIIGIIQSIVSFTAIIISGVIYSIPTENQEIIFAIIGLVIFVGLFIHLIGIGLGIAGLLQKNRKKVFSILGLIFNISCVMVVILIICIGLLSDITIKDSPSPSVQELVI